MSWRRPCAASASAASTWSTPSWWATAQYDVEGAGAHGLPTILVEWGYGSPAEAAGAIAVVHSADQLSSLLLG